MTPSPDRAQPPIASAPRTAIAATTSVVRDLRAAVEDCCGPVSPRSGLLRVLVIGAASFSCVAIAWTYPIGWAFVGWSAIAAIFYGFWLVATHDAAHHTLTGWPIVDEAIARAIAWPIFWAVGTYSELHRLHHSWNGRRLDDPERTEWTRAEYDRAGPIARWYVRHQWAVDVFGFGALGLIVSIFRHGIAQGWRADDPRSRVRWQLAIDVAGIAIVHGALLAWVAASNALLQYGLFWLVVERVVGAMMQCREHIEHYGLWDRNALARSGAKSGATSGAISSKKRSPTSGPPSQILTQLYATRNLHAHPIANWLMGGLPHHAVHHAFPEIPFDRLPIAFDRLEAVLRDRGLPPLVRDPGYWRTSWRLATSFSTIESSEPKVAKAGRAESFDRPAIDPQTSNLNTSHLNTSDRR